MIRVQQLHKTFPGVVAVDGISFEVRPGETFGLLGPNGAGKTTTLHMLVGLLQPDGGEIRINGGTDPSRPEMRRHIGIAPQSLSLYEDLTANENLRFFARISGLKGRAVKSAVESALSRAELSDRGNDLVGTYSGGMKRRLNMACALVHDPSVLFLDEPTIGVDPQARLHLLDDVRRLKEQNRTVIFTTHYMDEAQQLCDRVAIMDHGKILVIDSVRDLIRAHGGKSVVEAELEYPPENPDVLPGIVNGTTLSMETERPLEAVRRIWSMDLPIRELHIHRPNLESVFLELTGRRLRD